MTTLQHPPQPAQDAAPALGVLRRLFERLHAEGIRYCHWKSNEHLSASMAGATDVDMLVERRAAQRLAHILSETISYKRFVVRAGHGYPGIEDYVGFDPYTGNLTHLHVHYQLTLGEKFLKGHRLPWEEVVLETRVLDEAYGIYVIDPQLEFLILVARAAMKLRLRDFVMAGLGRDYFSGSLLRELRWLRARVRSDRFVELATPLVGVNAVQQLLPMIAGTALSVRQLIAFRRSVEPSLSVYRMYSSAGALRRMWSRELAWIWWRVVNLLHRAPTHSTRTPPHGGLTIGLVGPDGAGKSTLTNELARWLGREIAVVTTYGGSGKGSASRPRLWLQAIAGLAQRTPAIREPGHGERPAGEPSRFRILGKLLWVIALAREQRRWAQHCQRGRSRGLVVLSDRLPQSQFAGLNDGPRLGHWLNSSSWLRRSAAKVERTAIRMAELVPPDVVVRLHVPMDVAARRKPDTPLDQLRRKVGIVSQLQFPATTHVVEINAAQPFARVLLEVKQALWECF